MEAEWSLRETGVTPHAGDWSDLGSRIREMAELAVATHFRHSAARAFPAKKNPDRTNGPGPDDPMPGDQP